MTKIKTVRKWEKAYNIKLEWVNLPGVKVENVRQEVCKEYRLNNAMQKLLLQLD